MLRRTLTSRLKEPLRSVVRFMVVGLIATIIQYLLYDLLLMLFTDPYGNISSLRANAAYLGAFMLEAVVNYLLTSFYTFSTKPTLKNFGGFISSRVVNLIVQIGLLNLCLVLLARWEEVMDIHRWSGVIAILLAGIINYFVLRVFFHKKNNNADISSTYN